MDAMAFPRFDTKRGVVLAVTPERIAVALEDGIHVTLPSQGEWTPGQPVDVLLRARRALAVRPPAPGDCPDCR